MTADNSETKDVKVEYAPKSDVEPRLHEKSPERLDWEQKIRALRGDKQLEMVLEMKRRYESIIVTEETCIRFKEGRCKKRHPHHLVFYHPLVQGERYLEAWRNDE